MAYLLSFTSLSLIFLLHHPFPISSPLPTLLAYNCTPPLPTNLPSRNLTTLLGKLITNLTHTTFANATLGQEPNTHQVLVQCNPTLSSKPCSQCLLNLKTTIFNLCPSSIAASAWFEGCYLHYFNSNLSHELQLFNSHSNESYPKDRLGFSLALDGLLLQLAAGIRPPAKRGFDAREAVYDDHGRIFAVAECLRVISPGKCEECVVEAVKMVHGNCSGGFVVVGGCRVRFESFRFFTDGGSDSGDGSGGPQELDHVFGYEEGGVCEGCLGFVGKLVLCVGVASCLGVLLGFWVFRMRVCSNVAMVIPEGFEEKM